MEIVGDKPVATITPRDYDKYLEALPLLPRHRRTSPQTRDLSIQDILNLAKTAPN
jgi:hypothetical protein